MSINTFFDHIFCIYLEKRKHDWFHQGMQETMVGRYERAVAEFKKHGIEVEFIEGIDGSTLTLPVKKSSDGHLVSNGDMGCTLSHQKVAKIAKERGYKNYLVFEDDVVLHDQFNSMFEYFVQQLPENWDMLYLGGNHDGGYRYLRNNEYGNKHLQNLYMKDEDKYDYDNAKKEINGFTSVIIRHIVKMFNTFTTHAIAINNTAYDAVIDVWSHHEKVDVSIASLHPLYNCYCVRPHLAWQEQGFSDILERVTDGYEHLKEGNYEFDKIKKRWCNPPANT